MRSPLFILSATLALIHSALGRSSTGDRVLVVLESQVNQDDYSKFFASLKDRGFELTFKSPKDDTAELIRWGETQYDHLIVYAPSSKSFANSLTPKAILDAQSAGVNTLFLLSPDISEHNRNLLREYDLEFVDNGSVYLDAFHHAHGQSPSIALLDTATELVPHQGIFSESLRASGHGSIIYPAGTVHNAGLNPYLVDILHGSKTGYVGQDKTIDPEEAEVESVVGKPAQGKGPVLAGKKAGLVTALQTRDNVRVGFVGSGEMLSDKYWGAEVQTAKGVSETSKNKEFAEDFTRWIFQETGVVKVVATHHHREGESEPRKMYRKKDDLTYTITLAQHVTTPNGTSSWAPFEASDIQLDFTMLDPHYRKTLVVDPSLSTAHATTYKTGFTAPDRHGVFKFVVEYWRPGWSYIRTSDTASVVPLRHDEHPRFITGAWPFYSAALSASAAFLLFCGLWLALGEEDKKGKKKAE
ncbi:putative dolichyl-diphosphooligosaccharide--protein glycosyltransferase 48 kDa subunit precursor [Papiliotrema laurentii]|uniref:Dolichyl-diphosphooligosaccharide--protein glycosyltransferase subunit WBP1 n=1 Tax=Papiliotrema laurentii TaxID=5418 RepID=A0AAD9FX18_PAPLA|nr:putative dolichyl-diphosphooligosaccharide--protein glycosyltransferase 48 kDa subunit precursor [Papiliotrema laurentii]